MLVCVMSVGAVALSALSGCTMGTANALERVQATGVLRVALDPAFPPFEFVDAEGELAGLDVDLAREIAGRLGVEAHFVTTGYDGLYDTLTVNRADVIISALYPDPSRMHAFAFSASYFNAGEVLVVPAASAIDGVEDLAGKQVVLVFGTEGHMLALKWERMMDTPPVLMTGDSPDTVISVLAAGKADAAIVDHVTAQMARAHTPDLRVLPPPLTDEPYTIAAREDDAQLLRAIESILQDMRASGELEALIQRWMQ
jgi:ABC-type amino acid transport substrate-binding protein